MGIVLLALAGVAVVALLVIIFRARGTGSGSPGGWRAGPDGFFIVGDFDPGDEVEYECYLAGTWRRDTVPALGRETFVYTGAPPSEVRILGVVGSSGLRASPPSSGPASSNDDVFTGFPSAY